MRFLLVIGWLAALIRAAETEEPLPEHLTLETFGRLVQSKLSLVEFFSPYCHHCTAFAPTWEKTYREFKEEMETMGVQMRQVDCVALGDLCEQEDVFGYPLIRLYGPDPDTKLVKNYGQFPRTIEKEAENIKTFLRDLWAEFNDGNINLPLESRELTEAQLAQIIAGDRVDGVAIEGNPLDSWLISFWPASRQQWEDTVEKGSSHFPHKCLDCLDVKVMWDRVLGQVRLYYKTAHVMCDDHSDLCKAMGIKFGNYDSPQVYAFLPKEVGKIKWEYKELLSLTPLKAWAMRLWELSRYERVTQGGLPEIMDHVVVLPPEPLKNKYPLENRVLVIFFYDGDTVTPEDEAILSYALEAVMESPFNVYLYKTKHKKFEINMLQQAENLVNYINHIPGQDKKHEQDRATELATTMTTKPTFIVFKDNSLIHGVYQSFAPEDIRNGKKVQKWIAQQQFPLLGEITRKTKKAYFLGDDDLNTKVVVTIVDSNDKDAMNNALFNMLAAAHEYHYLREQYWFGTVELQRAKKAQKAEKLAQGGADAVQVLQTMKGEVPHFFDRDEAVFAYLDIHQAENLAGELAFDPTQYKVGDTVIVLRNDKQVWDRDSNGVQLVNQPLVLREVLLAMLDPKLVDPKVADSLYSVNYKKSGNFHYALAAVAVVGLAVVGLRWRRGRRKQTTGMGIIGNLEKKD